MKYNRLQIIGLVSCGLGYSDVAKIIEGNRQRVEQIWLGKEKIGLKFKELSDKKIKIDNELKQIS